MITITEQITINADTQKVWRLLSDFEISLNINLFHKEVIIPDKFSLTANNPEFNIIHNFGLGNINMIVNVQEYIPLGLLKLSKKNSNKSYAGFEHSSEYKLINNQNQTILKYSILGSFNFKVQNIPFKPILANVIKAELLNIKSMVESSEELPDEIKTKITTT